MRAPAVLCPIDFTGVSGRAVELAAALAQRLEGTLILHHNLDVRPPGYLSVNWMWSEEREEKEAEKATEAPERLQSLVDDLEGRVECEARLTRGPLESAVLYVARRLPADVIVMGSHGWSSPRHRSLTERIVLEAPCGVLTTGDASAQEALLAALRKERGTPVRLLVPVDFSPRADSAARYAGSIGGFVSGEFELLHVVPGERGGPPGEEVVQRPRERLEAMPLARHGATVTVVAGQPVRRILEAAAEEVHCIVMPANSRSVFHRLLFGDKTRQILHGAPCPVWFVPRRARAVSASAGGAAASGP